MSAARTIFIPPEPVDSLEHYRPIEPGVPPTLGRVAGLLRRVINYGKQLVTTVRLRANTPAADQLTHAFRTTDVWIVLHRLGTAISRAVYLEDKLLFESGVGARACWVRDQAALRAAREAARAASGEASAARAESDPDDAADPESRAMAAANKPPRPARERAERHDDPLPSTAQILAELRTRPVGAILADLCRDLGITAQHPLWPELAAAITTFGGSITELEQDAADGSRWCSQIWMDLPDPRAPAIPYYSAVEIMAVQRQVFAEMEAADRSRAATRPP